MSGAASAGYAPAAAGAWWRRLRVPLDDPGEVCEALSCAAREFAMPVTAALRGGCGDVTEVVLLRDPHRLPVAGLPRCRDLADALAASTGWRLHGSERPVGLVVPLGVGGCAAFDGGLVGSSADDEARRLFARRAPGVRSWPVRLAGFDGDGRLLCREPGVLTLPHSIDQAAAAAAAARQQRWCMLDPIADATRGFARRGPRAPGLR